MSDLEQHITRVSHFIDHKRWDDLTALFAPEVEVDYTSLKGGKPQRMLGKDLVGGWAKDLAKATTQHLFGPIDAEVTGDSARAWCHVRAFHTIEGKGDWTVMGHYVFELARVTGRWAITAMKLETIHQLGNLKLLA